MSPTSANSGIILNENQVSFTINGKPYQFSDLPTYTSLNTFIREYAHLRGTKFMCMEGGCGACVVSATRKLPNGEISTMAINSCLVPVYSCHGWAIETVESLGNKIDGYDKIQNRLVTANGTQCGYCSPGMVMNMYSLLKSKKDVTMADVENSFGGNICRCTGYRPILDAFKSLAIDAPQELIEKCADIEELVKICPKDNKECNSQCKKVNGNCSISHYDIPLINTNIQLQLKDGRKWYRVSSKKEIFEILDSDDICMLIGGNTAHGVYRSMGTAESYIDISNVDELHIKNVNNDSITLGANMTLTEAMDFFYKIAKTNNEKFCYAKSIADHIDLIANVPVRNVGTLAGNLTIKYQNNEFPSDIFVILEGIGAKLVIESVMGIEENVSLPQYLTMDMGKKIITKIILPERNNSSYIFKSYKIMPRAQNSHAYVNAAFLINIDKKNEFKVLEKPIIVFGSITPTFVHAEQTEAYLEGKSLLDDKVIKQALQIVSSELHPSYIPPDASVEYKKGLAVSLFYKFILNVLAEHVSSKNKSGGEMLTRPLSSGTQDYETDQKLWPLNKPVKKLEAYTQCSGEAEYVNDVSKHPDEVFAAVVVAKKAVADSFSLDPANALKMPGVIAFYSAKDIPGKNDFMGSHVINTIMPMFVATGEEIFASKQILFAGQALGVIVAETKVVAEEAAEKVNVKYFDIKKPITEMMDVINVGDSERIIQEGKIEPTEKKDDIKYKVKGQFLINSQYHYTMETQSCFCVPIEDGLDVYPTTQVPSFVQGVISETLKIPLNSVNVSVRRIGGGYGAKITRNNQVAAICALATHLTKRPVRLSLTLETNMQMIGKRLPCYFSYEAGVDDNGKIQQLTANMYQDVGATLNEKVVVFGTIHHLSNGAYDASTWSINGFSVRTDTPSNTYVRAPGSTEATACLENLMEHIANIVKKDPITVKLINMKKDNEPIFKIVNELKISSDYDKRLTAITEFNKNNRWKKRGISLVPLVYPFGYWGKFHANVAIFGVDGTVAISHGGIECGQGLNTKVAQVCAYVLDIPLEFVKVKPSLTYISPNDSATGGSLASEAVCYAVKKACEDILQRLEPIKKQLPPDSKWTDIVKAAVIQDVSLNANYMYKKTDELQQYNVYGVTVLEAEVDVLTGQNQILRVDLLEDAGQSLSPQVDIGQVEGAFVMGLGYYLNEYLAYDKDTGKLLTDRTWNYKPPGAKDIPIDFRVQLLRNSRNDVGVYRSKATGEPPLNMSVAAIFAIRKALESARRDAGNTEDWFQLGNPVTPEQIWINSLTDIKSMTL